MSATLAPPAEGYVLAAGDGVTALAPSQLGDIAWTLLGAKAGPELVAEVRAVLIHDGDVRRGALALATGRRLDRRRLHATGARMAHAIGYSARQLRRWLTALRHLLDVLDPRGRRRPDLLALACAAAAAITAAARDALTRLRSRPPPRHRPPPPQLDRLAAALLLGPAPPAGVREGRCNGQSAQAWEEGESRTP